MKSAASTAQQPGPFALGAQIFGDFPTPGLSSPALLQQQPPPSSSSVPGQDEEPEDVNEDDEDDEDDEEEEEEEDIIAARLESTTLEPSAWLSAPSYVPIYLSTVSEYLSPPPKPKLPPGTNLGEEDEREGGGRKVQAKKDKEEREGLGVGGDGWMMEGYENSLEVDHAFERFSKRVGYEGQQCLR